jgi:hypothetical protein
LTEDWEKALLSGIAQGQLMKGTPAAFFAKLIVTMWEAQTAFWSAYQERRNAITTREDDDSEKLTEIKHEITYLFSLRDKVLPAHINTYFPQDLDIFLQHSTQSQLQTYIQNYGKAIKTSLKQHVDQSVAHTPSIFTYPGFSRINSTDNPDHTPGGAILPPTINAPVNIPVQTQEPATHPHAPGPNHNDEIATAPPPILPLPNIPPPAPDETATNLHHTGSNARQKIQQSILATFRRRRTIREITPPPSPTPAVNIPIRFTPQTNNARSTVGDYINRLQQHPSTAPASSTDTEDTNTPPVIATRASPSYKHSKWRPAALVREKFSQYFRKR